MTQNGTGNQPEKKFRAGAISATIWLNSGQNPKTGEPTQWRTITLERVYKDREGQWKNTSSMRINDIPRATLVLNKAYEYILFNPVKNLNRQPQQQTPQQNIPEETVM